VVEVGEFDKQTKRGKELEIKFNTCGTFINGSMQRHDIQHNDTQHNDTQHKDTQHKDTQRNDTHHSRLACDNEHK
jgi:hypothetical protein